MYRDFTYVDDLVHAIRLLIDAVPVRPEGWRRARGRQPVTRGPLPRREYRQFRQGATVGFYRRNRGLSRAEG